MRPMDRRWRSSAPMKDEDSESLSDMLFLLALAQLSEEVALERTVMGGNVVLRSGGNAGISQELETEQFEPVVLRLRTLAGLGEDEGEVRSGRIALRARHRGVNVAVRTEPGELGDVLVLTFSEAA